MYFKPCIAALAAVFLMSHATPALASFESGNELHEKCTERDGSFGRAYCLGFVAATVDAHTETLLRNLVANMDKEGFGEMNFKRSFCLRQNVTLGQLRDVVAQYLERRPAVRDKAAAQLVIDALQEAFPCQPN